MTTYLTGSVRSIGEISLAGKKIRKSLDGLRGDIQELAESFAAFRDLVATQQAAAAAERQKLGNGGSPETSTADAGAMAVGGAGYVTMHGHFEARPESGPHRDYNWSLERKPIEDLLTFTVEHHAQRLAAIGHPQRLGILLMLLEQPATANDVVTELGLGTTGAAYHHLNVLQAAGLVEQQQRGIFSLIPNQVSVLLTVIAALSDKVSVQITTPVVPEPAGDDAETDAIVEPRHE
jgi:DNA-binding transcriptional ArsR family regulator